MKESPWFSGDQKPRRDGIYKRKLRNGDVVFSKWKGRQWHVGAPIAVMAMRFTVKSPDQELQWKGVMR